MTKFNSTMLAASEMQGWSSAQYVRRAVDRCGELIRQQRRIARDLAHLNALDDRMLEDLGLSRSDIGVACRDVDALYSS